VGAPRVSKVVELIWVTVDPQSCVPNPAMTSLAQHLVGQVMALRPRFRVALGKAVAGGAVCSCRCLHARARVCVCVCVCVSGGGAAARRPRPPPPPPPPPPAARTYGGNAEALVHAGLLLHQHAHHAPVLRAAAEAEGRDGGKDDDVADEFDDDEEAVKGMARLFCEVAEAYIQLVLAATPQVCVRVFASWSASAHYWWHHASRVFASPRWGGEARQWLAVTVCWRTHACTGHAPRGGAA
jgi:hypothetical protein